MPDKTNPFGLLAFLQWNHDWNNWHFPDNLVQKAAAQIKDLGVGMVRMDIVWSDIHRGRNLYDFSRYDQLVSILTEAGLKLLVPLHYNKIRTTPDGVEVWNRPPDSFEEFADYVNATVKRYKSKVRHWEIWNEPNHPVYWVAPPDKLATYAKLLRLSYAAAKRADPKCTVLNGGLTEPVIEDVKNLYAHGGKSITDVLAIHTFIDPFLPDAEERFDSILDAVRRTMKENGDAKKKIWITEMGCPGLPENSSVKDWWAGKNLSEAEQAGWLEKQYTMMRKHPFVEKIFWAFYRDTGDFFGDGTDYLGLVRLDLSPKPAFDRMKKLIHS
jgi:hypothetical protein